MNEQLNSIESSTNTRKSSKFVENTKRAVRKVLLSTGIMTGSMLPINTSTALPVSANKIIHIEPTTSTTIKTVGQGTTADLLTAFDEKDNEISNQEILENNNVEEGEEVKQSETDITGGENQNITENKNSNINTIGYNAIEINNINPQNILPITGQVETGDKQCYEHIEHLRVAEATRIRNMMREYGAGNHSAEEYKQLMMRLNTGMTRECPSGYDNYDVIGGPRNIDPSNHAHNERNILNTLVNHSNFKIVLTANRQQALTEFVDNNPNSINIFGNSKYTFASNKNDYNEIVNEQNVKDLCNSNNFIIFAAGTNIESPEGHLRNKIYNGEYEADEYGRYSLSSMANSDKNTQPNSHLLVTIGTNANGDIDQTNEIVESSKYPVGFHNKALFAGRAFPYLSGSSNRIMGDAGKYATSYTNYVNVALADLCFQMKADVADVDELLEMIRSTALTDYIRFDLNGDGDTDDIHDGQPETQPLLLMNPAGFFQKYLMPTSLPTNLKTNETTPLEKGYYHGVVYQIPGAEVNINGQWIPFTSDNKELIFSQNPMNLEWRLNGESINNYNYKPGDTISGQIIVVDDQWNGLNITKDFSINIEDASGINSVKIPYTSDTRYTIDGIRLDTKPTKPGIYIMNDHKVIIK